MDREEYWWDALILVLVARYQGAILNQSFLPLIKSNLWNMVLLTHKKISRPQMEGQRKIAEVFCNVMEGIC